MEVLPDGKLVYLYCSSIFNGENAKIRKSRKVVQLLEDHKHSIRLLENQFSMQAIAAVVKDLLEKQIFESIPRAKLRFPELFKTSKTQEAKRAALQASIVAMEAKTADARATRSDDEEAHDHPDLKEGQAEKMSDIAVKSPDRARFTVLDLRYNAPQHHDVKSNTWLTFFGSKQPTLLDHPRSSIPQLSPVYLPFRTQNRVLVFVQGLLEECCFDFGNKWVPEFMQENQWHVAESVELTKWVQEFCNLSEPPPQIAIKPRAGRSIKETLVATANIRHSAVHRISISAEGLVEMLSAALAFTEALKDIERTEKIARPLSQLITHLETIEQHQNLLGCRLRDQLEEIACRRAELDNLERSSIEEMRAIDEEKRNDVGSTIEDFFINAYQRHTTCTCDHASKGSGTGSEAEEDTDDDEDGTIISAFAAIIPNADSSEENLQINKDSPEVAEVPHPIIDKLHVEGLNGSNRKRDHGNDSGKAEDEEKNLEPTLQTLRLESVSEQAQPNLINTDSSAHHGPVLFEHAMDHTPIDGNMDIAHIQDQPEIVPAARDDQESPFNEPEAIGLEVDDDPMDLNGECPTTGSFKYFKW